MGPFSNNFHGLMLAIDKSETQLAKELASDGPELFILRYHYSNYSLKQL
jgi:hypothetical protein